MGLREEALELHRRNGGKVEIKSKVSVKNRKELALAYTPGVAEVCKEIAANKADAYLYTMKSNSVAVVSDGTAVLGLGDIGPEAAMPVMEGKAILFKQFAGVDGFPICLDTKDTEEIIRIVKAIAPAFGGINLEDISAPRCFEIEERLQDIGIPVFHDDQHGTAIVILAGLINASRVTGKPLESMKIVISGAGAAGMAVAKMLTCVNVDKKICTPVREVIICDSKGPISRKRNGLEGVKKTMANVTNPRNVEGALADALKGADVFIGLSKGNLVTKEMVKTMAPKSVVFAMANPVPEILPGEAMAGGAFIIGTGRSDFPNQINNVLAFPGVFRGALDARAPRITEKMKVYAARALAACVKNPAPEMVIPDPFDKNVPLSVAEAVRKAARE
ncbi:MAG: NADP-dependent malic enzyme [Candidatus Aenigmarchaeota archaeon]|nr:NADP-dependent malic enzyme [Candidatus Aenigmarchaeota archaeon]